MGAGAGDPLGNVLQLGLVQAQPLRDLQVRPIILILNIRKKNLVTEFVGMIVQTFFLCNIYPQTPQSLFLRFQFTQSIKCFFEIKGADKKSASILKLHKSHTSIAYDHYHP